MPYIEIDSRETNKEQRVFGYEIVETYSLQYEESDPVFKDGESVDVRLVGNGVRENYTGVVEIQDEKLEDSGLTQIRITLELLKFRVLNPILF